MTARILTALCFCLALSGANAQTTPPDAKAEVRETPPDQKAYTEAGKITDPEKKIAAYEKLKTDFPGGVYAAMADTQIFSTLVQKMPDQTDRIRKAAKAMFAESVAKDKADSKEKTFASTANRGSTATRIADQLATCGPASERRRELCAEGRGGIAGERLDGRAAGILRQAQAEDPVAGRAGQELRGGARGTRRHAGAGGNEAGPYRDGAEAAGRSLRCHSVQCDRGRCSRRDGGQSGRRRQGDGVSDPRASERSCSPTANKAFEEVYKKGHNGSLDGLEAMLDAEYRKRFPNPVHVEAYKPGEKRSDRMVLAEVFTGSGCPPCAGADVAFDAAMERYARKDLAVVMYHVHVPRPDPMTTVETTARSKNYGVTGVPTFAIDGKKTMGGGPREYAPEVFERFQKDLEKDLETAAEATVKIDAGLNGGTVKVSAAVGDVKSDSKDLKVQILLVEKEIRHLGENGIRFHPMVVRAFGGEKGEGYAIEANGKGTFDASFDLEAISKEIKKELDEYEAKGHRGESFKFSAKKYEIDRGDLAVVVFVQDDKTRHVLQAGYVDLGAPAGTRPTTEANGSVQ